MIGPSSSGGAGKRDCVNLRALRPAIFTGVTGFLLLAVVLTALYVPHGAPVLRLSFEWTDGPISVATLRSVEPRVEWANIARAAVSSSGGVRGKYLRVKYPEGSVGASEGGAQFKVKLPAADQRTLEYLVRFERGFDFRLGGKLPGLAGGRANTGGDRSTGDGWSTRLAWGEAGQASVYMYHLGQKTRYGDGLPLNRSFTRGRWYHIKQRVKVNTPDRADGELEVWVDGKRVLYRRHIRYRNVSGAQVDALYFSTFHGGASDTWAPQRNCYAGFDEFVVR